MMKRITVCVKLISDIGLLDSVEHKGCLAVGESHQEANVVPDIVPKDSQDRFEDVFLGGGETSQIGLDGEPNSVQLLT